MLPFLSFSRNIPSLGETQSQRTDCLFNESQHAWETLRPLADEFLRDVAGQGSAQQGSNNYDEEDSSSSSAADTREQFQGTSGGLPFDTQCDLDRLDAKEAGDAFENGWLREALVRLPPPIGSYAASLAKLMLRSKDDLKWKKVALVRHCTVHSGSISLDVSNCRCTIQIGTDKLGIPYGRKYATN
jgi:hypothetical protein